MSSLSSYAALIAACYLVAVLNGKDVPPVDDEEAGADAAERGVGAHRTAVGAIERPWT